MEARFYERLAHKRVICRLCPHNCIVENGKAGICKVRTNVNEVLHADNYESLSAINTDPIEKKPLYHFHPGSQILSLGAFGCNFRCTCCQNYEISQVGNTDTARSIRITVDEIVKMAGQNPNNIGIAFTYNEPTVWYEFMVDIAALSFENGYKNVMVSNGFIEPAPLNELLKYMDAFNIDIKAFDENTHKKFTGGSLFPVLDTIGKIYSEHKHLEITFLLVPGINDDVESFEKMTDWISNNLSPYIPFHISRYFPKYKMTEGATPENDLMHAATRAKDKLSYVYLGNIYSRAMQDTLCPSCGIVVIERRGYTINANGVNAAGECRNCGFSIVTV